MSDILLRAQVRVQTTLFALRHRQEGQGLVEYGLIIASIAILLIIAMLFLAGKIDNLFSNTGTSVETPGPLPIRRTRRQPSEPAPGRAAARARQKTRQRECAGPVTPSTGPAYAFGDSPFRISDTRGTMGVDMSPSRGSGTKWGLTFGSGRADSGVMDSAWSPESAPAGGSRSRERGQALVEFALIAPLFLLIVVGIIQFGIGLNYWLDLNRIANQGARWAVVDHGWTRVRRRPPATCRAARRTAAGRTSRDQPVSGGLNPKVKLIASRRDADRRPARSVKMTSCFTFLPIIDLGDIMLNATATMRIEQPPDRLQRRRQRPGR